VQTYPAGSGVGAIGLGSSHSCASVPGGLRCWGYNGEDALGLGATSLTAPLPTAVVGISAAPTSVAGGQDHSCAVVNGTVLCWGNNEKGQLGVGDLVARQAPAAVSGLPAGASQVSIGARHSCALVNGAAWCWGYGANGQLGNGQTADSLVPVAVSGLASGVSAISAGSDHTCAIQNGAALCWGLNTDGQVGNNVNSGIQTTPTAAIGLSSGVSAISAGVTHTCAVANGGAWCWGYDGYGQLGNGILNDASFVPAAVTGLGSSITAIVAGDDISCAVRSNSVLCWGADYDGDLGNGDPVRSLRLLATPVLGMSGMAAGALAIGGTHVCAITLAGGLYCWGDDYLGSLGIGREVINATPLTVVRQDVIFVNGVD
jgi:alpha-tubulin suppressor-like RCC1 family protein